jgi:hypothetical protein
MNFFFKKAYDRVEWPFILTMIKALGFGLIFIHNVETLFAKDFPLLSINKGNSKESWTISIDQAR